MLSNATALSRCGSSQFYIISHNVQKRIVVVNVFDDMFRCLVWKGIYA